MRFRNISEAEAALARYIPAVKEITGKDITLERMTPLMEALGNPQDKLRIIHVAGTSGKTSTSYYIAGLLMGGGRKVGLTVSPHIDSITERVQTNLVPLGEEIFCDELGEFIDVIEGVEPQPTYFELLIAYAYWYFAKVGVDYAVIETGLGGLYDATNIARRAEKVCVITDIGHDHTQLLGDTLEKIAAQKAGIIHKSDQVFMYRQAQEITKVFEERTQSVGASLTLLEQVGLVARYESPKLEKLVSYQQRNWLLARQVCEFVARRDGFRIRTEDEESSLKIHVPGRMDVRKLDDETVVLDGAHNEQKMTAFVEGFKQKFPGEKVAVLLSLKRGKEYRSVLPLLLPICERLIITTFDAVQDLPIPSMDAVTLAEAATEAGLGDVKTITDSREAYEELLRSPQKILVVTGSFFLVALARRYMMEGK